MRLRDLLTLAVVVAAPFVALYGVARFSRWRAGRKDNVDALILAAGAKYREGMEASDLQKVDRAGERVWQEALQGQRRLRKKPRRAKNVVPIRKVG